MRVLVIPEDFRNDQYVIKPVIQAVMKHLDVTAEVTVCTDPLLGGVAEALRVETILDVLEMHQAMHRLFILVVDRDAVPGRRDQLDRIEQAAAELLGPGRLFVAENAWQEIEVWALAGLTDLPKRWRWKEIRAHRDPKEAYYLPYAQIRGVAAAPAEGRGILANESAANYKRLRSRCPEDVQSLEGHIRVGLGV